MAEEAGDVDVAKADRALDALEILADEWSVEVGLPHLIKNALSVARLNPGPRKAREAIIHRAEVLLDAIVRQAFIEGSYRAFCAGADLEKMRQQSQPKATE